MQIRAKAVQQARETVKNHSSKKGKLKIVKNQLLIIAVISIIFFAFFPDISFKHPYLSLVVASGISYLSSKIFKIERATPNRVQQARLEKAIINGVETSRLFDIRIRGERLPHLNFESSEKMLRAVYADANISYPYNLQNVLDKEKALDDEKTSKSVKHDPGDRKG